MERKWTDSQQNAIDARGGSLIVSAAAGSGKTAVLVERVIKRITDEQNRIDADRLLIVTYTRLAAQELKERLIGKLNELVANDPFNANLLRQQKLMSKASICTIDSFCSSVVKEFFYVLDIERNFRIVDESEKKLIKNDALNMTLESMYADNEPDFFHLVEAFSGTKDDRALQENILKVHEFLRSHPFPDDFIDSKLSMFTAFSKASDSVWGKILFAYANEAVTFMRALINSSFDAISLDEKLTEKLLAMTTAESSYIDALEKALKKLDVQEIKTALYSFNFISFPVIKGYKENPLKVKVQTNRELIKDVVSKLSEFLDYDEQQVKEDVADLFVISQQLYNCVRQFSINYQKLKAERKVADYSDLEHWTIKLLVDPNTKQLSDIAYKLQSRFDEIMIDEYQDANEVQDLIFNSISKNSENLFFVGDVKQSIYGFRQAMPQLFLNRRDKSFMYDRDNPQYPAKIILDKNFRSCDGVIDAVNFFFEKLMTLTVGDIRYDETESLKLGADYIEQLPSVAYHMLEINKDEDENSDVEEARYIAEIIHKMIKDKYQVKRKDGYSDITYGDFAILMRSAKNHANVFVDTLQQCMIPATTDASYSFLDAHEIEVMTSFLSVIDNPSLDIELLAVLMSPIFGFTADEVALIRKDSRYTSLYSAVIKASKNGSEKCNRVLEELAFYRDLSVTTPVCDLLNIIYDRTGYMSIVSALSDNDIAKNNLRMLKEYAKSYESGAGKGLSRFVSYLNRLRENDSDISGAIDLNATSHNAVRIMSVHSSKGLEFPVCIIANTARKFESDSSKKVLLHTDLGLAVKRKLPYKNAVVATMPHQAVATTLKRDEMSEELRILYVAMTRAKQKLIMLSSHKDVDKYLTKMGSKLTDSNRILPFVVRSSYLFCEWITMCAMLHPDAKELRDRAGCDITPDVRADFPMEIVVSKAVKKDDTIIEIPDAIDSITVDIKSDSEVIDTLNKRLSFEYKKQGISKLVNKISASELAHKNNDKFDRVLSTPAFMSDNKLTAAHKGTALHTFMQFCDFSAARNDLSSEVERLRTNGYISSIQADSIDLAKAQSFVNSNLVTRCINSPEIHKEYRFATKIPAHMVDNTLSDAYKDEEVILQGAVDLAFVEDGELVIVDYKTDNVKDITELYDRYHSQLELYKNAMEQCTDYKVKECLIYSIKHSDYIKV